MERTSEVDAGLTAVERLDRDGWLPPFDLLDADARARLRDANIPDSRAMTWDKGTATVDPVVHEVATSPTLVDALGDLLGPSLMLWGARLIRQAPGDVHRWHIDAETHLATGPTIDVWVAVDNVGPESTLRLVPGSHHLERTIKDRLGEAGRRDVEDGQVRSWAREDLPGAEVVVPSVADGQAIIFDGRVWHATRNDGDRVRTALLLQYAAPSTSVFIPRTYDVWPPEPRRDVRPPCILVAGTVDTEANRFVTPPGSPTDMDPWIHQVPVPVVGDSRGARLHHDIFDGSVASAAHLDIHASTLSAGKVPHPPHRHPHEELLVVLDGDPELILEVDGVERTVPTTRGTVGWYPLGPAHTLKAVNGDATYVMFRWYSGETGVPVEERLALTTVDTLAAVAAAPDRSGGRGPQPVLFEGPTTYLRHLQAHATVLRPGDGYDGHVDWYDIVVVVLEGALTTNGDQVVPADGVVFWPAGRLHEARNDGPVDVVYLVFELHPGSERQPHVPLLRRFGRWLLPMQVKKFLKQRLPIPDRP